MSFRRGVLASAAIAQFEGGGAPVGDPYEWDVIAHLASPTAGVFTFSSLDLTGYSRIEIYLAGIETATDATTVQAKFSLGATPTVATHRWEINSFSTSGSSDADSADPDTEIHLTANASAHPLGNAAEDALSGVLEVEGPGTLFKKPIYWRGIIGYSAASTNWGKLESVAGLHDNDTGSELDVDPITKIEILGTAALTAGKVTILGLREVP